jgi:LAO/AO transport system kinase
MQGREVDKDVFIRSLASRGWKGGLSKATADTVHVMDAMGKDVIFVEAVGSGQVEVDIARIADTCVIVLAPGMGDEIQMMKAGILEVADVFAVNKADRQGAEDLKTWLHTTAGMKARRGGWTPEAFLTEAVNDKGVNELADEIIRHGEFLVSGGELEARRRERARLELLMAVEASLNSYLDRTDRTVVDNLIDELAARKTSPQKAAGQILKGL